MKSLSGWQRIFLVYALLSGLWCLGQGAESFRVEELSIYHTSTGIMGGVPQSGKLTDLQKKTFDWLRQRQETNLKRQSMDYGARWLGWLIVGAVAIGLIRLVIDGFAARSTTS
ncbi:hypothetical protein GCM10027318_24000 [Massilia agilis]